MIRDRQLTADPDEVFARYRAEPEKVKHGIMWPQGDDDAQRVLQRYFRKESAFRRLQLLYAEKLKKEGKYRHLNLFGFFLQLSPRAKELNMLWFKPKKSKKLILPRVEDRTKQEASLRKQGVLYQRSEDSPLSLEEMVVNLELYEKLLALNLEDRLAARKREAAAKEQEKRLEHVYGKQKKQEVDKRLAGLTGSEHLSKLAKPKDKWGRLRILMDLKKKFAHDISLQKMIREELKSNKVFRFPEEYDLYDEKEDKLCKHMGEAGIKQPDFSAGKTLREQFKTLDDKDLYYLKREISSKRRDERNLEKFLINHALAYLEQQKQRLKGQTTTVRLFVSDVYHKMVKEFKNLANERFPHTSYGTKKGSETWKKSYPQSFKNYFFHLVKSYFKQKKGLKRMNNPAPTFLLSGGKRWDATFNKRVVLKTAMVKLIMKEPASYRSRVWRRKDFRSALNKVFMLRSENENCTFEPEAGALSKTIELTLKANPNIKRDTVADEGDPENYIKKLGDNF